MFMQVVRHTQFWYIWTKNVGVMPLYVIVRYMANLDPFLVSAELISIFLMFETFFTRKNKKCIYACYKEVKYKFVIDFSY